MFNIIIILDNRLSKGGLTAFDVFVIVTCLSSLVLALRTILKRDSQMKVCLHVAFYVLLGFCFYYFIVRYILQQIYFGCTELDYRYFAFAYQLKYKLKLT